MDEPGYAPGLDMLLRASELPSETKLRSGSQPQHTAPKHAAPKQASAKPQQTAPKQTAPKQQQAVAKPQQAAAKQAVATKQAPVKPQQAAVKPQQAAPKPQQAAPKQAPPPKPQEQAAPRLRQTSQPVPPAKKGASAKEDSGATVTRHGNTTGKVGCPHECTHGLETWEHDRQGRIRLTSERTDACVVLRSCLLYASTAWPKAKSYATMCGMCSVYVYVVGSACSACACP